MMDVATRAGNYSPRDIMRCLYTMVYMGNRFLRARVHLPNDTVVLVPSGVAPSLYRSAGICADPFAE